MVDQASLINLGKLVAIDVAAGRPGANAQVASELVQATPGAVLDLIELVLTEVGNKHPNDRLISAFIFLIGEALQAIRYGVEAGHADAVAMADRVRQTLLGDSGADPAMLLMILGQFSAAKLDPGPLLREKMGNLVEQVATTLDFAADQDGVDSHISDLAKAARGDVFTFLDQMLEMAEPFPEDHRVQMIASLLDSSEPIAREAVVGCLLDSSAEVRAAVAGLLERAAAHGLVSDVMLRRMITMRNWLPRASRAPLDRAIDAGRRAGVACASWPVAEVREVRASGIDGAGTQSVIVLSRDARRSTMSSLLVKRGVGVRDVWTQRKMTKPQVRGMLEQIAGQIDFYPVSIGYVRYLATHWLAINRESGVMPPFGMLGFLEATGLSELQPEAVTIDGLLEHIAAAADPAQLKAHPEVDALLRSGDLLDVYPILDSWFEDGDDVAPLIRGKRRSRARLITTIRDRLLPIHRTKWAELLAWMALLLQSTPDQEHWIEFFAAARALADGRPIAEIPIMTVVAELTITAFDDA
ncbi:MAG: hypothetical protein P4M00_07120 [Azospirillaceae bacterium]|nr:hypothetical protein [Azospirillaceae bacterium]